MQRWETSILGSLHLGVAPHIELGEDRKQYTYIIPYYGEMCAHTKHLCDCGVPPVHIMFSTGTFDNRHHNTHVSSAYIHYVIYMTCK